MTDLTFVTLIVICSTVVSVKGEAWQKEQLSLYTYLQKYSGYIDVSHAFKTSLYQCIHSCFINSDSSFLYQQTTELCQCNSNKLELDNNTATEDLGILYGLYERGYQISKYNSYKKWEVIPEQKDCLSLYSRGFVEDGIYLIYPSDRSGVTVWCDMTNGGWIVIQRRQDGSEDFNKRWDEYVEGFGNKTGEYWLGLKNMNELTERSSSLYIEMETFGDVNPTSAYATYSTFSVDSISTNFTLHVNGYSGTCNDSLSYHNGAQYTTTDSDHDEAENSNCAVNHSGGWWFRKCHRCNLNGLYLSGNNAFYAKGVVWSSCWGHNYSLKTIVMKIRTNKNLTTG